MAPIFEFHFTYINSENEEPYLGPYRDLLAFKLPVVQQLRDARRPRQVARLARDSLKAREYRRHRKRPIVRDPFAVFSAPWFSSSFDAEVVVLIRHPASFAGSLVHVGWNFDFGAFVNQPHFMRDFAGTHAETIERYSVTRPGIVDQAILLWNLIYEAAHAFQQANPSWIILRHEDLARKPPERFEQVYERLDLPWDQNVAATVREFSRSGNPAEVAPHRFTDTRRESEATTRLWKNRLSAEEVSRIRGEIGEVYGHFYDESDWS
jgi:hypothetical protein